MLKHIYRAIILIAIFIGSLFYFGRNIKEVVFRVDETTVMSEATFPIITLKVGDDFINILHGYSVNMDANGIRDNLTPLDDSQSLEVYIDEKESSVKKVNYELRNTMDNSLIDSGSYSALDKVEDKKVAKIKIATPLEANKEYALKVTVVTAESKKINYYTRVIKNTSSYLNEKLQFVLEFHEAIFDKEKAENISSYLEPNRASEDASFAYVNIHSDLDLISFGTMEPVILSEVVPTVKEISTDLASIELKYFVQGKTNDGTEIFLVKEFYRVRYSSSRMYLLNYERTMEAQFDINKVSLSKSEFKIGVTNEDTVDITIGEGNRNMCFVRERELWYYNLDENSAVKVFSFKEDEPDYVRDYYDQHNIKVLDMSVEGDIDFLVYGYMNRGSYEGRVGILLYRYYRSSNKIEELVYIPVNEPYDILKETIGDFFYVNNNEVFYFLLNNTLYSYNMITKGLTEIGANIKEDEYVFSKEKGFIAWQESEKDDVADKIRILHLNTQEEVTIEAKKGTNLKILDMIDSNIIYGYAKNKDIATTRDGNTLIPLSELYIIDENRNILKTYSKEGYYVVDVQVSDNVIELERVKKDSGGNYVEAPVDNILNQVVEKIPAMSVTERITDKMRTELYITLTQGYTMEQLPQVASTANAIIYEDTTLRLPEQELDLRYVVYAYGEVEGIYQSAGEAITIANEKIGSVLNQSQQIIWQRGTRNTKTELSVEPNYSGETSLESCLNMIRGYLSGKNIERSMVSDNSLLSEMSDYIRATAVNLTGITLDEALYFINKGRPVIAMKSNMEAVLITGYDSFNITIIDPSAGKTSKVSLQTAEEMFEEAGNIFISYIE